MNLYDDLMNKDMENIFTFEYKFGCSLAHDWASEKFSYSNKTCCYAFPDTTSKDLLTDLIHKSLADNHDYVLDWAKKHGEEIVYEEGIVY